MSKRKILSLAMALCMIAILATGATLAYFSDSDRATNVFTTGKVDITLIDQFNQGSKLLPGTSTENNVAKVIKVTNNTGSENAYVRVHIALPSAMVDQNLNSYNDMLHWNFSAADYDYAKWSMHPEYNKENGWTDNGWDNQNAYKTTINGEAYTVWVVTYRTALAAGATTDGAAMTQVYMDWRTETTDGKTYTKASYDASGKKIADNAFSYTIPTDGIKIYVVAEGTQSAGFGDAYEALNEAFGVPGTYDIQWVAAAE